MTLSQNKKSPEAVKGFGWIVSVTSLAFVVSQLDVSIVNIALPQIANAYKAGISTLQWVIDAYTLVFAVFLLSAGNLSDLIGAKNVFRCGILIFGAASVGCGLAPNAVMLILFRILQGIGSATMIPSSLAILNQSFAHQPDMRARAVGLWTAAGGAAIAAGPILGGLLIQVSSWRYIFFVNVPLCIVAILLSFKLRPDKETTAKKKFDIPGQITWMLALTALIAVIITWPELGIGNPLIYGGLLFSGIMLTAFLMIENKVGAPMLPLHLFSSAAFNVLLLLGAVVNCAYYGVVFILSLYLQKVLHFSSFGAGLAFLPLTAGFLIPNILSGKIISKYGIRVPILVGLCLFAVGFAGLFIAGAHTPYWQLFLPFLIIPMGMGTAVPAMTTGTLASVDKALSGTASAVLNTIRQAAGAIGVAVFGAMAAGGSTAIVHAIIMSAIITIACTAIIFVLNFRYLKGKAIEK